jgi:hypothetical protein
MVFTSILAPFFIFKGIKVSFNGRYFACENIILLGDKYVREVIKEGRGCKTSLILRYKLNPAYAVRL